MLDVVVDIVLLNFLGVFTDAESSHPHVSNWPNSHQQGGIQDVGFLLIAI